MTTTTKRKSVCFAYFVDGKFLGWYADSFGSIRPTSPKVHRYSEEQVAIVANNFKSKLKNLVKDDFYSTLDERLNILDNSLNKDKEDLSQYSNVELKVVECPEYDGANPDFDKDAYTALCDDRKKHMTELGIFDIPAPSKERTEAVKAYNTLYPAPKCDNWVYADYAKVKEWAANEPMEFIEVITA